MRSTACAATRAATTRCTNPKRYTANRARSFPDGDIAGQFGGAVDMTAAELERWVDSDESKGVGQVSGGVERTGHVGGRRTAALFLRGNTRQ
ncbi:DUF3140 domain-containing protein [Mycolicibacterium sp. Dal123E01]|uniref:DUF3140 domain-containing protein n=1 Tax=Mycolicibacterium sp. Dal123E01 TaxID=3457578 RepID=UPI00403EC32C